MPEAAGIAYERAGSGPPLLLIHGLGGTRGIWRPQMERLTQERDVIAVDMPIGLPERTEGSGRVPEQLIRPLLGARQSSVFAIPSRRAVEATDYAEACAIAAAASGWPPCTTSRSR